MAKQRSTFAKLQRDLEKKAKTAAKVEKRANRAAAAAEADEHGAETEALDESVVIAEMAKLQAALEEGTLSMDEFQSRREALTSRLHIS